MTKQREQSAYCVQMFSMRIFKIIFIASLAVSAAAIALGQGRVPGAKIKISAEVDRTAVPLNRTVQLTVTVSWQGDLDRFRVEPPETPALSNLEVVGSASSNWVGEEGGVPRSVKTYEYTLRPLELGMGYIDPVRLYYVEKDDSVRQTLQTGRLEVAVTEPVSEAEGSTLWIWLPAVIVLVVGGAGFWLWRQRRKAAAAAEIEVEVPIEDRFLEELKSEIKISSPDLRNDFAKLSRILRKFLAERYDLPGVGMSTSELVQALQATSLRESQLERVQEALGICDVAKFSGGSGSEAELLRAYTVVEGLLTEHREARAKAATADGEQVTTNKT